MENTINTSLIRCVHIIEVSFFYLYLYSYWTMDGVFIMEVLLKRLWIKGVTIFLLLMATAFIGYASPNKQMFFWERRTEPR